MSGFRLTILMLMLAPVTLVTASDGPPRVALHWLWHEKNTDSAYTVTVEGRERLIHDKGYVDMGPIAFVETRAAPHVQPLKCFYAAAPRTNTFCSISAFEQKLIRSLGYVDIGTEGFVHDERFDGSVVLFRVSRSYGDGKDREHRFVISGTELRRLRKLGWTYDGSKGFVFPPP